MSRLLGFPLIVLGLLLTGGCGRPQADASLPFAGQVLNVFNWSDYIAPGLIEEFQQRTGARVQYDNFSSDQELEARLLTGGGGYDVVFPSDKSLTPLLKKGLLAELDRSLLPNFRHIDPQLLGTPHDPDNRHSVPYFWGTLAVGVRTDHVPGPVKDFSVLFDERYKGRITMLDDAESSVAAALLARGHSLNATSDAALADARAALLQQKPLVQSYTSDGYKEKLLKGDAWVVLGWSGDILQARKEQGDHPTIQAVVPVTGTMKWVDSMSVPKEAPNPALAHAFINFLLEPEIAARNAAFLRYPTPNRAARPLLDPRLLADPAVFPPAAVLARCEWLRDRGADVRRVEKVWQEVRR